MQESRRTHINDTLRAPLCKSSYVARAVVTPHEIKRVKQAEHGVFRQDASPVATSTGVAAAVTVAT